MTDVAVASREALARPSRPRRLLRWLATDLRAALALVVLLGLVIVAAGAPQIKRLKMSRPRSSVPSK